VDAINTEIELSDAERLDRLRLIRSENVGPRTFRSPSPPTNHLACDRGCVD